MNTAVNIDLQEIIIINIIASGSGFAQLSDGGEQVFIPASVVNGAQLQIGERVDAVLVPNMNEMRDRTPWRAVRVPRDGIELPPLPKNLTGHDPITGRSLDQMCYDALFASSDLPEIAYLTTREVSEELNADVKMVGNALQRLFNAGRISRAEVHHRVGQARASFILWALQAKDFVGPDAEEEA
jgi:cold shock CspA family protein